jgi:hypothetical protein
MQEHEKEPPQPFICTANFCLAPGTDPADIITEEIKRIQLTNESPVNQQSESC